MIELILVAEVDYVFVAGAGENGVVPVERDGFDR